LLLVDWLIAVVERLWVGVCVLIVRLRRRFRPLCGRLSSVKGSHNRSIFLVERVLMQQPP
jgi:hypothetical protein